MQDNDSELLYREAESIANDYVTKAIARGNGDYKQVIPILCEFWVEVENEYQKTVREAQNELSVARSVMLMEVSYKLSDMLTRYTLIANDYKLNDEGLWSRGGAEK